MIDVKESFQVPTCNTYSTCVGNNEQRNSRCTTYGGRSASRLFGHRGSQVRCSQPGSQHIKRATQPESWLVEDAARRGSDLGGKGNAVVKGDAPSHVRCGGPSNSWRSSCQTSTIMMVRPLIWSTHDRLNLQDFRSLLVACEL